MNALDNFDSVSTNSNSYHANNYNSNHSSFPNKDLINLSRYSCLSPVLSIDPIPQSDLIFLNNLQERSLKLPSYKALVGGSEFNILIDSGASTNYVHPKLVSHSLSIQRVETADGKQCDIDQKVEFRMFLGDNHEHEELISAYVFDTKFDIILGRKWLKETMPKPDWMEDTWQLKHPTTGKITQLNPISAKSILQNEHQRKTQSLNMEDLDGYISQDLFSTTTTSPTAVTDNTTTDYLLSDTQVARLGD